MRRFLHILAITCTLVGPASAIAITQAWTVDLSVSATDDGNDKTITHDFDLFDPALGTLISATLQTVGTITNQTEVRWTNTAPYDGFNAWIRVTAMVDLASSGFFESDVTNSILLSGETDDLLAVYNHPVSRTYSFDPANILGTGSFSSSVRVTSDHSPTAGDDEVKFYGPLGYSAFSGVQTLTYTYNPVPSGGGTLALLATPLLGMLTGRRYLRAGSCEG